ncbi:MAG: peptidylprolyl isomerase [Sphingomonadales bacterium]
MSIIQDIRDKYAKLTVVLVALALLGFILTDYFAGKSRMSGQTETSVGSVNGKSISFDELNAMVVQAEENMKSQGYPQNAAMTQQALEQAWNQKVSETLLLDELSILGIAVSKKELGDILYGVNAPQDLQNQFRDTKTGLYNGTLAKQNIDQLLKTGTPDQKKSIGNYINALANMRMSEKYSALFSNSTNYPRWMVEKQNAESSQMARLSIVRELYTNIPDSSVRVSDAEIEEYIKKNKTQFKQQESRSIYYVSFSAAPSVSDSAAVLNEVTNLKERFKAAENLEQFLAGEGAQYYDGYVSAKSIQLQMKDSIFKTPVGEVYGPYQDAGTYTLARMVGKTSMPDTVSVRHILISTQNRDSATAYNLCDSVQKAIAGGAIFDSLVAKYSDDQGSKSTGGRYENVPSGQMVGPFNDFIFLGSAVSKGIVKTNFGFHYIEVLSQKGSGPAYKVAYLPREIVVSQETDNAALNKANAFAGDSKDLALFEKNYDQKLKVQGITKGTASDITPVAFEVRGVGASRSFVRAIYEADKGDVLKPERIENNYIVAAVYDVIDEGTATVNAARASVDPILRNKKKATLIAKKLGNAATLEAAASALGGKTIEVADSVRMSGALTGTFGYEPRVTGAAFNPANKGRAAVGPIEGLSGVFVIRVDNQETTPVVQGDINSIRQSRYLQAQQAYTNQYSPNNPISVLRSAATIKDKRQLRY